MSNSEPVIIRLHVTALGLSKEEFWEVAIRAKPGITYLEYDQMWEDYELGYLEHLMEMS